jgi:hypoxanthine phosphoribosyltransferase
MSDLIPALPRDEIGKSIAIVARKISSDHKEHKLNLICILKGAFIFLSDLVRQLSTPIKIDFLRVASYGSDSSTSGKIQQNKEIGIGFKLKS